MIDDLDPTLIDPEDYNAPFDHEYVEDADELEPLEVRGDNEPLLTSLLRESLHKHHSSDPVINDFIEIVLPSLIPLLAVFPAKGGDFAADKAEQGADTSNYGRDQSLRAHIVNGLFATINILNRAAGAGNEPAQRRGDYGRRLLIATYMLHDYNKMPEVKQQMGTGLVNPSAANIDLIYEVILDQAVRLHLPDFISRGGHVFNLSDLVYTVHNTQVKSGTLPPRLLKDRLSDTKLINWVANFSRIADLLAYGTFLELDTLKKINDILVETLTDPPFRLKAHRITQVTGIVTSFLHNAVVSAMREAGHEPILFAPNGVIYASPNDAPIPELEDIAQAAVDQVQHEATKGIERLAETASPVGIAWGTQGLKTAPFIEALYTPDQVLNLVWRHLQRHLIGLPPRKREQLKVFKKLESGQKEGWSGFEPDQIADLSPYMDERAEALGDWLAYASALDAKNDSDAVALILTDLGFDFADVTTLIVTAQKGGVQFWPYLLALRFISGYPAISPEALVSQINTLIDGPLAQRFSDTLIHNPLAEHVRQHALEVILLPEQAQTIRERFAAEIGTYTYSKTDNKRGVYDTIYNIPHGVEQQQEATLPYMPTPYSQRLPLGSSDSLGAWRRGLSGIGVVNMLLMQTALRQPFQFEERKGKMLFLYPAYYFTPETGDALLGLVLRLRQFDLNAWLKHTQYGEKVDATTVATYHAVTERPASYRPPVEAMRYPVNLAPTMVQIAVDPGKDATDAASWINAVFMALIMATVVDVKIVISDSPVPLYASGVNFNPTVVLDAPHAAFADLIGREINVDHLLGALQRLTVAIAVTRDAYGYDKLDQIVKIARDLSEESAQVFRGYQRIQDKQDSYSSSIARRYIAYVKILDDTHPLKKGSAIMNHARKLVELYRQFYRVEGRVFRASSYEINRPLTEAADVIVQANLANSDPSQLVDTICGKLEQNAKAMIRDHSKGYVENFKERDVHIRAFAEYFVYSYFGEALKGNKIDLRGRQFNLLKLACEAVYRSQADNDYREYQSRRADSEPSANSESTESEDN